MYFKLYYIVKLQTWWRNYYRKLCCLRLISKLNLYESVMKECYIGILKTLKVYPPAKNECKFIYGYIILLYLVTTLY